MEVDQAFIQRTLAEINALHRALRHAEEENAALTREIENLRRDAERSQTDELTGLYGRRWLRNFWNSLKLPSAELSAVLVIDVNLFKQVNDRYGHNFGDRVLAHIAEAIRCNCRYGIRTGGDEFLALVGRGDDPADAARRIEREASRELWAGDEPVRVTVSIGFCRIGPLDTDLSSMIEFADREMYRAKRSTRGVPVNA